MTRFIRPILTAILLLSFALENVALSTVLPDKSVASHGHGFVQHKVSALFSWLAEENEERNLKDECGAPPDRDVSSIAYFPLVAVNKITGNPDRRPIIRSLPIYTYHCSLII